MANPGDLGLQRHLQYLARQLGQHPPSPANAIPRSVADATNSSASRTMSGSPTTGTATLSVEDRPILDEEPQRVRHGVPAGFIPGG